MALTGIQIYKVLPKTNCKKCGLPTCLAFAMKLAQGQAELSLCPDVSDEARVSLEAASRPPMRLVTIGAGAKKLEVGGETMMFRHEKTFFHPAALVVRIRDTAPDTTIVEAVQEATSYSVERVGMTFGIDGIAIQNDSGDGARFATVAQIIKDKTDLPLILMSTDPAAMNTALDRVHDAKPAIYGANRNNIDQMIDLAKKHGVAMGIRGNGLDELAELSEKAAGAGVESLMLDPGARGLGDSLRVLTQMRRLAIKKGFRPMGFPTITFPGEGAASLDEQAILAAHYIAKYGSIIVLDTFSPAMIYPLITLRLNIYTDPQKPIQMAAGIYPIGNATADSPFCVTTNFSLTYFTIAGELEASGVPSWLMVCDTEGLSVLTAWSAGKFDAEKIAKTVMDQDAPSKINHRKMILPGRVAILKGELENELPDWKILVGPAEAMDIGGWFRKNWT
ncbi:MAG: acetyl-CoA decarbonylase/synthase complex subunit gamma [Dehalococcoidia bacterium]|nr:acetyl-CoA decarbonylase/synthase complex subunit gamma [Dehalococcoidia bacterium]